LNSYIKAALLVSILTVWVVVAVFQYLNRYTQRKYFTTWTTAWLCYAVFLTLNISDLPRHFVLEVLKYWTVGASALFLLWGSLRFLKAQCPNLLLGATLVLLVGWSYWAARQEIGAMASLWVQAPAFLLLGIASGVTAYAYSIVWRRRSFIGAGLLSIGFSFWGLYLTTYPFLQFSRQFSSMSYLSSAILQLFIAMSMILLALEEVRATAKLSRQRLAAVKSRQKVLQSKVQSTEDRYQKLFEQAGDAIIIASAEDLKILEMNDSARVLLGASNTHDSNLNLSRFCLVGEGGQHSAQQWFTWVVHQRVVRLIRGTGTTVQVEVSGSPIWFEGVKAYQFFFREMAERARAEEQLRNAEKLAAIGQMITGISHELNNPLTATKGYLELVLAHHSLTPETRRDLERASDEAARAARLIQNFLVLSRQHSEPFRPLDLRHLMENVLELRKFEIRLSETEVITDFAEELPFINGNEDQLKQVFLSLVNNALQAMENVPRKTLRIAARFSDQIVHLSIGDSGPGIPTEILPRIFEPFFTTKTVGAGTGLGLSLAYNILREHKGRIYYEATPGNGATFVIELPAANLRSLASPVQTRFDFPSFQKEKNETESLPTTPPQATPAPPAESTARSEAQSSNGDPASTRILILDDETSISELLAEMLSLLGYAPVKSNNPREALELIQKQPFDLILSDFRMPGMNGQEFYEQAISQKPDLSRRIIFLTGDVVTEETKKFLERVGNPHLAKPFQLASVQQIIAEALEESALAA
jgi:PAS domain S-box-containing protein